MIKLVPDVGAPVIVTVVDLVTEAKAPAWNEWAAYAAAVGGYGCAMFNFGGDFAKNVGISSFDWAAKKLYARIRGGMSSPVSRMSRVARVARYPAPADIPEFQGVKLV